MDSENQKQNKKPNEGEVLKQPLNNVAISDNKNSSIKRIRTYEKDLKEAQERAGLLDEKTQIKPKKKGWFSFGSKSKSKNNTVSKEIVEPKTDKLDIKVDENKISDVSKKMEKIGQSQKMTDEQLMHTKTEAEKIMNNEVPKNLPTESKQNEIVETPEEKLKREQEEKRQKEMRTLQPVVGSPKVPHIPFKKPEEVKTHPKPPQNQPSKERIESELEQSGVIPQVAPKKTMKSPSTVHNIKTYKTDAAEEIVKGKKSIVSIAAESEKKRVKEHKYGEQETTAKKISVLSVSVILIIAGIIIVLYFYINGKNSGNVEKTESFTTLINANSQTELPITGLFEYSLIEELNTIRENSTGTFGSIINYKLTDENVVDSKDFLNKISINIPGGLVRTMGTDFMFGVYIGDKNEPFIILKTTDFENAFAGMLSWEETIFEDLSPLFGESELVSATSTINKFSDVIVKNNDTRLLRADSGESKLIYSFPNTETIIITTNEEVFFELFKRLKTSL